MSPTTPDADDILREDNYFVWEFNARMKLAKKGLLEHLDAMKAPEDEHFVILLGSLTRDYDPIVKIIEIMPGTTLFQAKEMLRREYDAITRTEHQEVALKSTQTFKYKKGPRRHMGISSSRGEKFSGRCYGCNKYGHKRQDCKAAKVQTERTGTERAFTASSRTSAGWLLDSGARSHMCPNKDEFLFLDSLTDPIMITIADGSEVEAQGVGTVRVRVK
ncbi:unnamed protein product [Peronospora effusa]|nr:unnamed protein product [Peronospora effusa]